MPMHMPMHTCPCTCPCTHAHAHAHAHAHGHVLMSTRTYAHAHAHTPARHTSPPFTPRRPSHPAALHTPPAPPHAQVVYIRDIPAPSPRGFRPAGALADAVDPARRVLSTAKLLDAALGLGSLGMGLAKPLFAAQARWQADTLADAPARAAAISRLDEQTAASPVLVYTYGLSPFSTAALALLDATGCTYTKVEVGLEWFLLDGDGSALRAELLDRHGQSSLPHVFIGGQSVGGLYTGSPGLVELRKSGTLLPMLREAGALQ